MESVNNESFSKSILDKFRLISKESEDSQYISTSKDENGKGKCDEEKRFQKRKHTDEEGKESLPGLTELDVGITQYISSLEGFLGIIKHRYSDFQVNEIDSSGNVIELTSLEVPKEEVVEACTDVLTPEEWKKVEEIAESNGKDSLSLLIEVTDKTKEERSDIHKAVKKMHDSKVVSNTKDIDGKKYLEIKKMTKREGRSDWPRGRGSFLHCTLFKVNKDMTELVHLLSYKFKTKANLIGYAGTKDKRAKTTQRISLKRRTAECVSVVKFRNVLIGNYSYNDKQIQLGDNKGNRFRIAIRNVNASDEIIEANMKSLKENGFLNYFGMQRFGIYSEVPTYAVGKALLSSNWKSAVELILKPRTNAKGKLGLTTAQKNWFKDRDAAAAVHLIPKHDNSLEARILRTLKSHGNTAYMNALMALPRHTMTMYLHSYQSLIWNRVVSRRVEKFGLKPLPGDLVVVEESETVKEDQSACEDVDDGQEDDADEEPTTDQNQTEPSEAPVKTKKMKVREISENEIDSIHLSEIVYPLPGHDISYPNNEIKHWYDEILAESNFTLADLNNTHKHFALGGAYRRLLVKPEHLSWETVNYDKLDQDLILSDEDKLNGIKLPDTTNDALYKAVVVSFNLNSCSYATMALREIMKCDTSTHHHSKLTELHENDSQNNSNKKIKT